MHMSERLAILARSSRQRLIGILGRAREEQGVALLLVMAVSVIALGLIAATFSLAQSEVRLTSQDTAAKRAYYAALAGINAYAHDLTDEPNFLNFCTTPPVGAQGLNQYYKSGTETPMSAEELYAHSAEVPGSEGERYAIQLVPAKSAPSGERFCQRETHIVESMVEESEGAASGSFRIIATGFASASGRTHPDVSSVTASFRNLGFTSFVYYTEFEVLPPIVNGLTGAEEEQCRRLYQERPSICGRISFVTGDEVRGPMHTQDHVSICGSPIFGRNTRDRIEFADSVGGDEGYSTEGACSGTPTPVFKGTKIPTAEVPPVKPPPNNTELELLAKEEEEHGERALFSGHTEITLEGQYMKVRDEGTEVGRLPIPAGGVVYVASTACSYEYQPINESESYSSDSGCGDAYVKGEYTKSLTVAAQNDIIITGNITTPHSGSVATDNALFGLVANNFVRIYHRVSSCNNTSADLPNIEIWAAILSVTQSFIVDNYNCGEPLGKLTVHGAIAQIFRGPVGTFYATQPPTTASGYTKEYEFDERLRAAEPPHFLSPVGAAWRIQRQTLAPSPSW